MATTVLGEIQDFNAKDEGLKRHLHSLARICGLSITENGQVDSVNGSGRRDRFLEQLPGCMTFVNAPGIY